MAPQVDHVPILRPRRRDILAFGTGLALSPAVAWAERDRRGGLGIGYYPGRPTGEGSEVAVTAADRLAAGDPSLARGVRVTVHGLLGDGRRLTSLGVRSAELKVGFPVEGVDPAEVELRAWSYQLLPVEQFGSPNSFTVPIDQGLPLVLEIEAFGSERFETLLTTGREPGQPKLRAGHYLIAPGARDFRARHFDASRSQPMIALSVEPLV